MLPDKDRRKESRFEDTVKRSDRRKGPDTIIKLTFWFGLAVWVFFILSLAFAMKADPDIRYRFFGIVSSEDQEFWDLRFFDYAMYSSVFLLIISLINITFRTIRHKRKGDRFSYFSIVTSLLSLVAIVLYHTMR